MSNPIIISRETALDMNSSLELALEDNKPSNIIISTTTENAFEDAKLAIERQLKITVDGTLTKPSEIKTSFKKNLFLFSLAKKEYEVYEIEAKLTRASLRMDLTKLNQDGIFSLLEEAAGDNYSRNEVVSRIKEAFKVRVNTIRNQISVDHNETLNHIDASYKDGSALNELRKNKRITFLSGEKGSGKSELAMSLFSEECDNGNFPILINSSRALAASMLPDGDDRFYMNLVKGYVDIVTGQVSPKTTTGLLGVVNTVLMNDNLKPQRELCRTLIIDEGEDVLDHLSGGAVGRFGNKSTLNDMTSINEKLESLIRRCDKVIFIDASVSLETVARLQKINSKIEISKTRLDDIVHYDALGNEVRTEAYDSKHKVIQDKEIVVIGQKSEFKKPVVRIMNTNMATELTNEHIKSGNKCAIFNDGAHNETKSSVNACMETFKPLIKGNYALVDGAFMNSPEGISHMFNKNAFAKSNDVVFYNTAAKNGLSIIDNEYKMLTVFSNETASATGLIQSFPRFRCTEVVNLCFNSVNRNNPQTKWSVLSDIMRKELLPRDITEQKQKEMSEDKSIDTVLERIVHKNTMNDDYKNTVIIMLEIMGYEIEIVEEDKEKESKGKQSKKAGKDAEREIRTENVINADKINDVQAEKLVKTSEFNSQENKNKLENFNLRDFYNTDEVTEDLMKFDSEGKGRTLLNNMSLLRDENSKSSSTNQFIKKEMFNKFFELVELDINKFGSYSNIQSDAFQDFVLNGSIELNDNKSISAKEAFYIAFPDCNLNKRSMSTVSSILTIMFRLDKPAKGPRKNGKTTYIALPNQEAEMYYKNI